MKERPILFSGAMVRALLTGTKTQTRRVAPIRNLDIKRHDGGTVTWGVNFTKPIKGVLGSYSGGKFTDMQARSIIASEFNPYGLPGDRLWVREAWRAQPFFDNQKPSSLPKTAAIRYEADEALRGHSLAGYGLCVHGKLRPSMFMPRWASRITLEVTRVRVERLQDISKADAIAEGIEPDVQPGDRAELWRNYATGGTTASPVYSYETLWESINGPGSWDANPWVWCISFARVTT